MNNRLLHAAARGARLQSYYPYNRHWRDVQGAHILADGILKRVHPADTDKLYGPISSALREAAEDVEHCALTDFPLTLPDWWLTSTQGMFEDFHSVDIETRRWFLLMLAEELSWSGL